MARKNYALDLYQTKTKGTGSLRATKWHQELCNGVKGNEVIRDNQHSEREWTITWNSTQNMPTDTYHPFSISTTRVTNTSVCIVCFRFCFSLKFAIKSTIGRNWERAYNASKLFRIACDPNT